MPTRICGTLFLRGLLGTGDTDGPFHCPTLSLTSANPFTSLQALLLNPAVALEPYLAQLMPPLLTCMLAKSLGGCTAWVGAPHGWVHRMGGCTA